MGKLIKILHIDSNWQVIYILIRNGALIKTTVSMETAILLLKNQEFDLILSEPQNIAILANQKEIEGDIAPENLNHRMDTPPWKFPEVQPGEC
jgi:hypothetical protein